MFSKIEYKSDLHKYLSPIVPDFPTISEWRPHPFKSDTIIGTWAEDGSEYEINCPHQLRDIITVLQNLLPSLIVIVEDYINGRD